MISPVHIREELAPGIGLRVGDVLHVLREIPSCSFDAVVTDPPYSSGGLMRGDRTQTTAAKYSFTGTEKAYPLFSGDNKDQRSFTCWSTLWMAEALRVLKPGGILMCFTDWRQLPCVSDAIQAGGFVWRGFVTWDKTEGVRPQRGWFRNQCEYVMLASNGPMDAGLMSPSIGTAPCLPGVWRGAVNCEPKLHQTGKPVALMSWLLSVLPQGAAVLDPFAGSGPVLVAAQQRGMTAEGIEITPEYAAVIRSRFIQTVLPLSSVSLHGSAA